MLVVRPVGGAGEAAVHEDALVAGAAVELHGGADLDQSEASTGLSNNQSQLTSPPRNRQVSPSPTQRSVASPGAPSSSRGWVCNSAVVVCSDSLHVLSINIYLSEAKHKVPQSPGSTSDSLLSVWATTITSPAHNNNSTTAVSQIFLILLSDCSTNKEHYLLVTCGHCSLGKYLDSGKKQHLFEQIVRSKDKRMWTIFSYYLQTHPLVHGSHGAHGPDPPAGRGPRPVAAVGQPGHVLLTQLTRVS